MEKSLYLCIVIENYSIVYLDVPNAVFMKLVQCINFWGDFEVLSCMYYVINNKRMIGKHAVHPQVAGIYSNAYYLRAPGNAKRIRFQNSALKKNYKIDMVSPNFQLLQ